MTSFWQNNPEINGCSNRENTLENIILGGVSCTATRARIEEANALNRQNELKKAYGIYKDILDKDPGNTDSLFGIGVILEKQQKFNLAIQFLSKALDSNPGKTQVLLTRGRIFRLQGASKNAISDFTEVISNDPHNLEALIARGITFGQTSQFKTAIDDFSRTIGVNPSCAEAFYNRGVVYEKLHKFEAAIGDYSTAIKLRPKDYKAYNNRGLAFREIKQFDKSIRDLRNVLRLKPNFPDAKWNLALIMLMTKNFAEGWQLYEQRWESSSFPSAKRNFLQPLWLGQEPLKGKRILIHSEQGLGDSLQFCRYLNLLQDLECEIHFEVERPLVKIMSSILNAKNIIAKGDMLPIFDFHCPLMSLPLAFGTTLENIPLAGPYLFPEKQRISFWQKYLGSKKNPRIGLAWQGNPSHPRDADRSIPLQNLVMHLSKNIDWFVLQKDVNKQDRLIISKNPHITHFADLIEDFNETGALCSNLDAVVSVDTSVAHLAGSIGTKTFLFLPYSPDARWFDKGETTPWYQSMELIRQDHQRDWGKTLEATMKKIVNSLQITSG